MRIKRVKCLQKERTKVERAIPRTQTSETVRWENVIILKLLKNMPTLVIMIARVLMMESSLIWRSVSPEFYERHLRSRGSWRGKATWFHRRRGSLGRASPWTLRQGPPTAATSVRASMKLLYRDIPPKSKTKSETARLYLVFQFQNQEIEDSDILMREMIVDSTSRRRYWGKRLIFNEFKAGSCQFLRGQHWKFSDQLHPGKAGS